MLKQKLEEKYSSLRNAKYIIAVDRKVIIKNTVINETSDVALLPPFSGG
jgi:molybdopterin converting factor small subunit